MFIRWSLFTLIQAEFDPEKHIKARSVAELNYQTIGKKKSVSLSSKSNRTPASVRHKELYVLLDAWRADRAEELGVQPYQIFATKSLLELVNVLPTDRKMLKRVKGFGDVKVKQFGEEIIEMIETYAVDNGLETNLFVDSLKDDVKPKEPKVDTKTLSLDLFKQGKSIAEICTERGLKETTIIGHLAHFVPAGEVKIEELMPLEKINRVRQVIEENPGKGSKEIYEILGPDYSYGDINVVRTALASE